MREDFGIIGALLGHDLGAVLAHAHTVTEAGDGKDEQSVLQLQLKGGGAQRKKPPQLRAAEAQAADNSSLRLRRSHI